MSDAEELRQSRILSQWIVSIAVSVVCCAVLFLVFAQYIIEVHSSTALAMVKIDVLQERQNQLLVELDMLRRPMPVTVMNTAVPQIQPVVDPAAVPVPTPAPAPAAMPPAAPPTPPAPAPEMKP